MSNDPITLLEIQILIDCMVAEFLACLREVQS